MKNDIKSNSLTGSTSGFSEGAHRATGVNPEVEPVPPPLADMSSLSSQLFSGFLAGRF